MNRLVRLLPAVTLLAVLVVTATSEFRLAVDVLALPLWVAWGVPAAIDSYVVAAVRTRRDVGPAMLVMALSLFAAAGSHLVAVRTGGRLPVEITGPVSAVVLSVLVLVAWRVHVLIDRLAEPQVSSAPHLPAEAGTAPSAVPKVVTAVTKSASGQPTSGPGQLEADLPQAIDGWSIGDGADTTLVADLPQETAPNHLRAVAAEPVHHLVHAAAPPAPGAPTRRAIRDLMGAEPGLSQRAVARRLGISPSTVARALRLPDAPDAPTDPA